MSLSEKEIELVDEFAIYDDWMDKYEYIIELGKDLPLIDEAHKIDENIIKGCQSTVWLHAVYKDGKVVFTGDADAIIVKGLVAILVRALSEEEPDAIINNELEFVKEIGLQEHLSPTRSNGVLAMIKQMKMYALGFKMENA